MLRLVDAQPALMPFRRAMMADSATMAYNAPWFPPDGTMPFPEEKWAAWLARWAGHEPERYCGYLLAGDTPVGEVCWHGYGEGMGVVIKAEYRGHGYGAQGLVLLCERAFSHPEIIRLCNTFEDTRDAAMALHLQAGFVPAGEEDGCTLLCLTREAYEQRKGASKWID